MCCRCKKRPAIVFVSRIDGDSKPTNEGYCIQCAKELNIAPINEMLKNIDISDEQMEDLSASINETLKEFTDPETGDLDIKALSDSFASMLPEGMSPLQFMGGMMSNPDDDDEVEEVIAEEVEDNKKSSKKKDKSAKKQKFKFLDGYCTNLTERAEKGELDKIIGRQSELYRVIQILSRRQKNNRAGNSISDFSAHFNPIHPRHINIQ